MIDISPFAQRIKSAPKWKIPIKIKVDDDIFDFSKTPEAIKLRQALANALHVWSNQSNTHFCDKASQYLLPFVRRLYPDASLIKIRPKGVNYHIFILFGVDKVLDTQLSQFNVPEKVAKTYIFHLPKYLRMIKGGLNAS